MHWVRNLKERGWKGKAKKWEQEEVGKRGQKGFYLLVGIKYQVCCWWMMASEYSCPTIKDLFGIPCQIHARDKPSHESMKGQTQEKKKSMGKNWRWGN